MHMVIFRSTDGRPSYQQAEDLDEAVRFVEHLRNTEQVVDAWIFRMQEVSIEFRTYYRVEVADGDEPTPPAPTSQYVTAPANGLGRTSLFTAEPPPSPIPGAGVVGGPGLGGAGLGGPGLGGSAPEFVAPFAAAPDIPMGAPIEAPVPMPSGAALGSPLDDPAAREAPGAAGRESSAAAGPDAVPPLPPVGTDLLAPPPPIDEAPDDPFAPGARTADPPADEDAPKVASGSRFGLFGRG